MTSAQSVYYTAPSGAGVFTAGTLRWDCALADRCERPLGPVTQRFVRIVTGNVLTAFAKGPVGDSHPARDNVADFDLPVDQLGVGELRRVDRPSAIMGRMVHPGRRWAGARAGRGPRRRDRAGGLLGRAPGRRAAVGGAGGACAW